VLLAGHRPVFADVDPATGNVSAQTLADARTPRTRAAMVVHYAGLPVAMSELVSLELPIIEDAAHAVDSHSGGRPCGSIGTVGVFSFDSVKNVATPGGGGVASPDAELLSRVRSLRYCGVGGSGHSRAGTGRWWIQHAPSPFPRATPNDVSAAIGLAQLARLPESQHRRRQIWERYDEGLAGVAGLLLPARAPDTDRHSYFTYLIRVEGSRRDALAQALLEHGVYTTLRFHPLHLNPAFAPQPPLRGCELLAEQGLNLPLHPRLDDAETERIIELVRTLL
jgi:aminotransferase